MSVRLINPDELPEPRGYSHVAVGEGKAVLLAGQIGCGRNGRIEAPDDLVAQFSKALDNMLVALAAAGGGPDDLAYLRIFTTDVDQYRAHLSELGAAWKERFGRRYPPMVLAGVTQLFEPGTLVELEGIAYVG